MSATPEEQLGLQRAIDAALAKERRERGITDEVEQQVLYICVLSIAHRTKTYSNKNLEAFIQYCETIKKSFPKIPMHIFTYTELQSDQSTKTV